MKTKMNLVLTIILMVVSLNLSAQTAEEILNKDLPITFIGLDFSACKGVALGCPSNEMVGKYIPAINQLLIVEPNKYDLNKAFKKTKIQNDFAETERLNAKINVDSFQVLTSGNVAPLDENKLAAMAKKYNMTGKSGVGLVFIVESLDKTTVTGTYHAVFFSMSDGKIIMNQKYQGRAMGFGMRNFWAASFYSILKRNITKPLQAKYLK